MHRLYYGELRSRFGLPSQSAVLCLKQVARLCRRATQVPEIDWSGPVPYDRHLYSLKSVDVISLATLSGRVVAPCTLVSYRHGELAAGSGELRFHDGDWIFAVRTKLTDTALEHVRTARETTMSDKLLNRITRLISGITHNALSQAEQAAAVPVMEQAIRDIDEAIKEVRAEIGKSEATKYNVGRRISELQGEHEGLNEKISLALKEDKEDLAEAGAGRQLDIETQLTLLRRTLEDADGDIAKLSDSVNALQASRREAQQRLRDLKTVPVTSVEDGAPGGGRSATTKAIEAIEGAQRLGESLTGVPAEAASMSHKDLEDLAELHRQHAIRERLAEHKARIKAGD